MRVRPSGVSVTLAAAVILFQLACPLVIAAQGSRASDPAFSRTSDVARYRSIARADGTPYQDFEVEYPPVAYAVFRAVGPRTFDGFRLRLLALQVACQALVVFLLFKVWGNRAAWSYLLLSAPMLFVVYSGFDLVGVALAVSAAALVKRGFEAEGAIGFAVAAFAKVWPVVLLPGILARRGVREFLAGLTAGLGGLALWSAWGGNGAIGQVLTYRGARGWEYESIPGSLLRLLTRGRLVFEAGAWRVGAPPRAVSLTLSAVLVGAVLGVWWLVARRPDLPDGVAETAVITAVLVFATLLSPQFVIWTLPFVAIAAAAGAKRLQIWAGAVACSTLLVRALFDPTRPALFRSEIAVLGRNVALVGLLVVAISEITRHDANRRQRVASHTTL